MLPNTLSRANRGRYASAALYGKALDDDPVFRFRRNLHRDDLVTEMSGCVRRAGAAMAFVGEAILLFAREAELGCDLASLSRHRHGKVLIPEPVVNHCIDKRSVTEAIAVTRVAQQIGCVRHRLHAAGRDDGVRSCVNRTHRVDDREQARRTDFVDGIGGHRFGESRFEDDLARGILPDAGLQDFAERYVLDLRRIDLGALDRAGERDRTERRCGERSERSPSLPNGVRAIPMTTAFELMSIAVGRFAAPKARPAVYSSSGAWPDGFSPRKYDCERGAAMAWNERAGCLKSNTSVIAYARWSV